MYKLNTKGFGGVEAVLVIFIVGLITGTGWYLLNQKKAVEQSSQQPSPANQQSEKPVSEQSDKLVERPKYADVPSALKESILSEYKVSAPGCLSGNDYIPKVDKDLLVASIYDGRFAKVNIGCDGSGLGLFALWDTKWVHVNTSQMIYRCDYLNKYNVPSTYIKTCISDGEPVDNPNQ